MKNPERTGYSRKNTMKKMLAICFAISLFICGCTKPVVADVPVKEADVRPTGNTISFDFNSPLQTVRGFGFCYDGAEYNDTIKFAAVAMNANILNLEDVYDEKDFAVRVSNMKNLYDALNGPVTILTVTSPPDSVKNNGTLLTRNGKYLYDSASKWIVESVKAYIDAGIKIDYIVPQSQPDYNDWGYLDKWCSYGQTEGNKKASICTLYVTLYDLLQKSFEEPPKMLGFDMSEPDASLGRYINTVEKERPGILGGISYRLSHNVKGLPANDRDNNSIKTNYFSTGMSNVRNIDKEADIFMTGHDIGTPLQQAELTLRGLIHGQVTGWCFGLTGSRGSLVSENGAPEGTFDALSLISRTVKSGYTAYQGLPAKVDGNVKPLVGGFLSPDGSELTVIIINNSESDARYAFGFDYISSECEQYYFMGNGQESTKTSEQIRDGILKLPCFSITSVVFRVK